MENTHLQDNNNVTMYNDCNGVPSHQLTLITQKTFKCKQNVKTL